MKKPNGFLYFIFYILIYPFLKICFRLRVDRADYHPPDGPFVVVANHVSFMDFALVMLSIYPRRLNAVAAQKFFFYRPLDRLLPLMGCIAKKLFDADAAAIKGIMGVIRSGGRLLLFPEGRCTTHGSYMGIHKANGKLLKKLAVPVVSCRIEGAYICMPFWRKGLRFGPVSVTLASLFTPEELSDLSVDEVNRRLDRRLSGADATAPPRLSVTLTARRLVEGLENILYICPACGEEFTLATAGNVISCAQCRAEAVMGRDGRLRWANGSVSADAAPLPSTVAACFDGQWATVMARLGDEAPLYEVAVSVRMAAAPGRGLAECGRGMLRLDGEGWHFDGELAGAATALFFPLEGVPALPFDPADNFQIYDRGQFYAFCPLDEAKACVKYAVLGECMYRRYAAHVQMTDCVS